MKKFTKFLQVTMVLILTTSIAFGQTTTQESQMGLTEKEDILRQKQIESQAIESETDIYGIHNLLNGLSIKDYEITKDQQSLQNVINKENVFHTEMNPDYKPSNGTQDGFGDLLMQIDIESIIMNNRSLGAELLNGYLYITYSDIDVGNRIAVIDTDSWTLIKSIPQGTTTPWGMRDLCSDGTFLYASDEDGFYRINPSGAGTVTTLFDNTAPVFSISTTLRALAYDGAGTFWSKNWSDPLVGFDLYGNIVEGPYTLSNSAYGACWEGSLLWLHATSTVTSDPTEFVQVNPATGIPTGLYVGVPDSDCSVFPIVGGAFFDNGNLIPGRTVFGALIQGTTDVVHLVEYIDVGYPGSPFNEVPTCGSTAANTGNITWVYGINVTSYDLWFGPEGSMTQVISGASPGGPAGFFPYSVSSGTYEWQVVEHNGTGTTTGQLWSFIVAPPGCNWEIIAYDDYGDGWNGGYIDIFVDGNFVMQYTLSSGAGPESVLFPIIHSKAIDIVWTDGGWPYEAYYYIYDNFGTEVASDGIGGNVPVGISGLPGYCEAPPNDACFAAEPVVGPYPVMGIHGTTLGATVSCPGVLDMPSGDVWYAIDLPYSLNTVVIDYCGDALMDNGWIVATEVFCSCILGDYIFATSWDYLPPCINNLTFADIVGPTTLYYPVATGSFQENFTMDIIVYDQSPPPNDDCTSAEPVYAPYPQYAQGCTFSATQDCPGVLDWDAVWYEIELPYEYNFVRLNTCLYNIEDTLNSTGIILTTDCSCNWESFIYSTGTWYTSANCINNLCFLVEGPGTVYYPVLTLPEDYFMVDVNVTELHGINGTVSYANSFMTPMDLTEVVLDYGTDAIIETTLTDFGGNYVFDFIGPGTYTLGGTSFKPWGGLSMNDVQFARQFVVNQPPGNGLSGIHYVAGDINYDGSILMNDVQAMWQEATGNPPGFLHYWMFENPSVNFPTELTQDFQAICSGDTDGSYIPPPAPQGASCVNAIPIVYSGGTLSLTNQTNCGYYNLYDETCLGYYDGGEDIIYELTVTGTYTVDIILNPNGTTWTGISISYYCPGTYCIDFSTNISGTSYIIGGVTLYPGTYYIMVDTWPSPYCIPDFDLTIDLD